MGLKDCRVGALIAVSDLGRARRFYEDQLGLVPGEQEQEGVRYDCAEGTSIFVYLQPHNAGASPATLAGWTVDDLDQTMDELSSRGVKFEHYDQPGIRPASAASSTRATSGPPGSRTPTATPWPSPSSRARSRRGFSAARHKLGALPGPWWPSVPRLRLFHRPARP